MHASELCKYFGGLFGCFMLDVGSDVLQLDQDHDL
jgi:hypothetical protein